MQETEHPALLLAVPGSGKTTVLVTRLGYMIYGLGIRPEEILTMTYTVSAARDMKERFVSLFGAEMAERLEFRTINGVSARIISVYARAAKKTVFELMTDEGQKTKILGEIGLRLMHEYLPEGELKALSAEISYIKNMMLTESEIDAENARLNQPIAEIYREYSRILKEKRLMDYDDQMVYALRLLERSPAILDYFRKQYRYFCVDEAQDSSRIQHAIIDLLAAKEHRIFMVGDEDQSIYGFRAACPEALMSFEDRYPDGRVLYMEQNFRSAASIVEAADRFIRLNADRRDKRMFTAREEGCPLRVIRMKGRGAQYTYLMKVAEKCSMETAVLYRDNESALPLIDLLERAGIPYRMRNSDWTFFSNRVVTDIKNIIRFAYEPDNTELFLQIYYKLNLFINKNTAMQICMDSEERHEPVLETACYHSRMVPRIKKNIGSVMESFETVRTGSAKDALFMIVNVMGYGDYLERTHMSDSKLVILRALAANEETAEGLLKRLDALETRIREKEPDPSARFILSTIHSSKGLEYDTVYLLDTIDGIFPEKVPKDPKNVSEAELKAYEEERRIFYVGVTRAKNALTLFSVQDNSTFIRQLTGEETERLSTGKPKTSAGTGTVKTPAPRPQAVKEPAASAKTLTQKEYEEKKAELEYKGTLVHKKYGNGVIQFIRDDVIEVEFPDRTVRFSLRFLLEKGLIR